MRDPADEQKLANERTKHTGDPVEADAERPRDEPFERADTERVEREDETARGRRTGIERAE